jgi:phage baseplate assembly protein V
VTGPLRDPGADTRFLGVSIGIVTNNKDPDGLGRVKLALPWLADGVETDWARVASLMAGKDRGCYFLPEVDDEVLVAFEHGDPECPYVLGALWNGKDKPPVTNSDGKNDVRTIRSRSGHQIRLTDTQGSERIEIVDKSGKNSIVIDTKDNTITVTGGADIAVKADNGALKLHGRSVEIVASGEVKIEAKSQASMQASGQLRLKGQMVHIN